MISKYSSIVSWQRQLAVILTDKVALGAIMPWYASNMTGLPFLVLLGPTISPATLCEESVLDSSSFKIAFLKVIFLFLAFLMMKVAGTGLLFCKVN